MWGAEIDGLRLTFHLAGINNQNFLMRDDQTGTYWQQISGAAVAGPLAGRHLKLIHADELTFAVWKAEEPGGTVLDDVTAYASEYAPEDWDADMSKSPTVLSFPDHGMKPRDLMLGIRAFGASRALLYDAVIADKLVEDRVGSEPVILVVGPDGQSVRAFRRRIPDSGTDAEFYRATDGTPQAANPLFVDDATASAWNFQGCAVAGKLKGTCLDPVELIKDYWFDWRNYNPSTTVFREGR